MRKTSRRVGDAVDVLGQVEDRKWRRRAWVERYCPDGDDGWVYVWLKLAGRGLADLPAINRSQGPTHPSMPRPRVAIPLVADREDRVHGVEAMRFHTLPDALTVVYRFYGGLQLCRLRWDQPGLYGVQVTRLPLGSSATLLDSGQPWLGSDTLCHLDNDDTPLVYGMYLPTLRPLVPIPTPATPSVDRYEDATLQPGTPDTVRWEVSRWQRDDTSHLVHSADLRLPASHQHGYLPDPEVLWHRLRAALTFDGPDEPPPDGTDILIGAVATPYWSEPTPSEPGGRYQLSELPRGPWWFPAAWYHYLRCPVSDGGAGRPGEAAAWLAWLERLAEPDPAGRQVTGDAGGSAAGGWDPEWSREEGLTRFALRHVRHQAAALASACRAGQVPRIGDVGSERPPLDCPPGLARAWRRLPETFRYGPPS